MRLNEQRDELNEWMRLWNAPIDYLVSILKRDFLSTNLHVLILGVFINIYIDYV